MSEDLQRRKARKTSIVVGLMGLHKATIIRMVQDGRLDGYRVGHLYYIYLDSVEEYRRSNCSLRA